MSEPPDKRGEILQGVLTVIAQEGLPAVSFRNVAREAGVSVGRVQHYFGSKNELVRGAVTHLLDLARRANPETQADPADPRTLEELLTHSLAPAAESRAGTSIYYSFLAASVADPWIAECLAEARTGLVGAVGECLAARRGPRATDADDAERLVLLCEGATQAVFIGAITADQARGAINRAIEQVSGAPAP